MFIGREKELNNLNGLYHQNRFHLFILYGRRRVGKTTLLKEFCKDKAFIFFSAEQSNEKMNLEKFSNEIFRHYKDSTLEPFSSFENAFRYIHNKQDEQQLVLVLDEFPYLAHINKALISTLQHLIDHTLKESKLFIVLCGSYMGFMEKEVLGSKSPLFGRRTGQLHLKSFSYLTSVDFLNGFSDEDKLTLYGAVGGTAFYLEQVRHDLSVEDNIKSLFLNQIGYLYEEPLLLLKQEVQEPGVYFAIIEAIAKGAATSSEISGRTGEDTAKCLKYIKVLRELGIAYKEIPLGEKEVGRKARYRVSDLMFRFWFRFVAANKSLLETGALDIVWQRRIQPDLPDYMGHVFELICQEYVTHLNNRGELPILATKIGRWWGSDPIQKKEVEIDLVARDNNDIIFGECKWTSEPMKPKVLEHLESSEKAFRRKTTGKSWYYLFSKSGHSSQLTRIASTRDDVVLVTLGDMLSPKLNEL